MSEQGTKGREVSAPLWMEEEEEEESRSKDQAKVQFRTTEGRDIGPHLLDRSTKLVDVKKLIFDHWPAGSLLVCLNASCSSQLPLLLSSHATNAPRAACRPAAIA